MNELAGHFVVPCEERGMTGRLSWVENPCDIAHQKSEMSWPVFLSFPRKVKSCQLEVQSLENRLGRCAKRGLWGDGIDLALRIPAHRRLAIQQVFPKSLSTSRYSFSFVLGS